MAAGLGTWGIGVQCDCYYWHTTATTKDAMKEREDTTDAAYRSTIPTSAGRNFIVLCLLCELRELS